MTDHRIDLVTGAAVASAPAWAPTLAVVNQLLTFASLALGIAFLVWRWWRLWRVPRSTMED